MKLRVCLLCLFALVFTPSAQAQLTANLQGYWAFDGNGLDSSGQGRDVVIVGGAGFGVGLFGQSLSLTGNPAQFAVRPVNDVAFDLGGGDFTVQTWVNFNSAAGEQTLIEKFTGPAGPGWTLTKLASNQLQLFAVPIGPINSSVLNISTGTWHQFVARRNGSTFTLFFDGASVGTLNSAVAISPSIAPLLMGERMGAQQFPVNGRMDETAFWSRSLSDGEITGLWNGGAGQPVIAVPEPASLTLVGIGAAATVWARRRIRRRTGGTP